MAGVLLFRNVRLVDPATRTDMPGMLLVTDGRIGALGADVTAPPTAQVIDGGGAVLAPGLVDMLAWRSDPEAATAGGVTTLALMPDQSPVTDSAVAVEGVARLGEGSVTVVPLAAATKALEGREIAEIGLMLRSGAKAIATGRGQIASSLVMHRVMQYAAGFQALVIDHAEDTALVAGACATESELAARLGLASAPAFAEAVAMARDIRLAQASAARLHVAQVTTREGFALVRQARAQGIAITCGVTPAHLLLNDIAIGDYRTYARLSPPLRGEEDRLAVVEALADGTLDVLCSGHDPRSDEGKRVPYGEAEPGMSGLETLLTLALIPVHDGRISLLDMLAKITCNPARLLGLEAGTLAPGLPADLVLFDPEASWRIRRDALRSRARNTPFDGLPVQGQVIGTWKAGRQVYSRP